MLQHLLIFLLLKELHHEQTLQNVPQVQQTFIFQNCLTDTSAQCPGAQHSHAWRYPPLTDGVLFPGQGVPDASAESEREKTTDIP